MHSMAGWGPTGIERVGQACCWHPETHRMPVWGSPAKGLRAMLRWESPTWRHWVKSLALSCHRPHCYSPWGPTARGSARPDHRCPGSQPGSPGSFVPLATIAILEDMAPESYQPGSLATTFSSLGSLIWSLGAIGLCPPVQAPAWAGPGRGSSARHRERACAPRPGLSQGLKVKGQSIEIKIKSS